MEAGDKCTLHFASTQRSKIDRDWSCPILIFSNIWRFSLRPLFIAYEDRENLVHLTVETYEHLALNEVITPPELWVKITAIMTDSLNKNLKIEDGVADALKMNYKPYHLLCKSHLVETCYRSMIEVSSDIEKELQLRERFEMLNPSVKSSLRGEKSVAICGIKSTLNLISHNKSASSTNQADLFDFILQRENQVKHIWLY